MCQVIKQASKDWKLIMEFPSMEDVVVFILKDTGEGVRLKV